MNDETVLNIGGYSTFNDVDDFALRIRNRGVTLVNMVVDLTKQGLNRKELSARTAAYLDAIPMEEHELTVSSFEVAMLRRFPND